MRKHETTFWKAKAPTYEQRRSLLIDLPGYGLSDKPEIPYTMELIREFNDAGHFLTMEQPQTDGPVGTHSR